MFQQMAHPDLSGISSEEIAAAEQQDYPGVNENVEQGAVPLSKRLRNPRAIISIVVPLLVLLLPTLGGCSPPWPSTTSASPSAVIAGRS
jgi:hypothetical protein